MLIYLAGAISLYHKYDEMWRCRDWRDRVTNYIEHVHDIGKTFDPTINFERNLTHCNGKSVLQQNRHYVKKSDLVIVNLEDLDESPGTLWEIFIASEMGIPVIAFGSCKWEYSPHVAESITIKFESLKDVLNHIHLLYHKKI